MTVFHTVDFWPSNLFCGNFKTKSVSCDNIQTTLGKTLMSKRDINFLEITLSPHSCLLGNYSFIFGGYSENSNEKSRYLITELNFFSAKVFKSCQLRVVNSFIQQRFQQRLWCKVNWKENFLSLDHWYIQSPSRHLWWSSI